MFIAAIIILTLVALLLLGCYICFRMAFYSAPRKAAPEFSLPPGDVYEPYREVMTNWAKETAALPSQRVSITSFDGLKLSGKYFEYAPGAIIELMLHGYRGSAERDLCGGVQRCYQLGRSVLLADQRGSGLSDGNVISFGVNEHRDCLAWVDFLIREKGPDVRIILTGISMGAATVMMAAGKALPPQVVGVIADCGYSSQEAIIREVIRGMKLPDKPLFPLVKLGAKLFGKFDLMEYTPLEGVKNCKVPIFFAHGKADGFVPCAMSEQCYAACTAPKLLLTVPGAEHGLSFPADPEGYLNALRQIEKQYRV